MAEKEWVERGLILGTMATYFGKADDREEQATIDIWNGIKKIPAADVVEVVRCKDCKNAYINSFSAQSGIAVCRFLANRSNGELAIVQQDDFCSYGERKEQK